MQFAVRLNASAIPNLLFLHRGIINPHSSTGEHYHILGLGPRHQSDMNTRTPANIASRVDRAFKVVPRSVPSGAGM